MDEEKRLKRNAYMRQWYKDNPPDKAKRKAYYDKNRKRIIAKIHEYYIKNKDKIKSYSREFYHQNKNLKGRAIGGRNYMWKDDKVGYWGLHSWIERKKGRPNFCEFCGKKEGRFHWANTNHKYRRNLHEWIRLCPKCHYYYDVENNLRPPLDYRAGIKARFN